MLVRGPVSGSLAAALVTLGAAFLLGSGCNQPELKGGWADREIRIDGDLADWGGEGSWFDNERVTVGACNDDHFLYLMLSSPDPTFLRHVVAQGLTVWIDPRGGKDKALGIRYPLGLRAMRGRGR